jgi:CRP-like cAMP-binding protein
VHLKIEIDVEKSNRWPVGHSQWAQVHTVNRYEKSLQECRSGDFFGERELIDNSPRSAGAFCDSQSALLYIVREEFFAEIFSDKDRKILYQFSAQRPLTTQLRFQLEVESKQRHLSTEAMLNAINTNSLPAGRDLFLQRGDLKRVEWARRLVAQQKTGLKQTKSRQVKKFETLSGRVSL